MATGLPFVRNHHTVKRFPATAIDTPIYLCYRQRLARAAERTAAVMPLTAKAMRNPDDAVTGRAYWWRRTFTASQGGAG